MDFLIGKRRKLAEENAKLKKDNFELLNRGREMRNQMVVIQTNFNTEIKQLQDTITHMQITMTTSIGQMDKLLKATLQKVSTDEKVLFGPSFINENYDIL